MLRRRITRIGSVAAMLVGESWTIDDKRINMGSALDGLAGQGGHHDLAVPLQLVPQPFKVRESSPNTRLFHSEHREVCLNRKHFDDNLFPQGKIL